MITIKNAPKEEEEGHVVSYVVCRVLPVYCSCATQSDYPQTGIILTEFGNCVRRSHPCAETWGPCPTQQQQYITT